MSSDQPAGNDEVRPAPDEPPLQQHGDPLLAAAEGHPQGDGSRHGFDAHEQPGRAPEIPADPAHPTD